MKALVGIIVVVGVVLGGIFLVSNRQATSDAPGEATKTEALAGPSSIVGSIREAMGLGRQMRCTYAAEVGGKTITSTVYVEGQKFKSESEVGGMKVVALSDGETQYVWNSGSNQGFQLTKACMERLQASLPKGTTSAPDVSKPENYEAAFDAAKDVRCEATSTGDFSIPKGITFTDQCAMMEQSQQMMEQAKKMMPQGGYPGQ